MTKDRAFQALGAVAIGVLAKCAAKKAVIDQLRSSGNRTLVPHREIVRQTKAYLAEHPELRERAFAQAWQMSIDAHAERIERTLFGEERKTNRSVT
jgi:hypothetical protein